MSYDILVTSAAVSGDDSEIGQEIDRLLGRHGPIAPRMDAFFEDLIVAYPNEDALGKEEGDAASPWSSGSLRDEFDADRAYLPLRHSAAEHAVPTIIDIAHRHGLAVIDCSALRIHRGDGHRGFRLDVEGRPYLIAPREDQIREAVAALSPDGAGAFLALNAPNGDYAQVAGGLGEYVFERRDDAERAFRHWVAGRGMPATGVHRVQTRGAHVEVKAHEVLSAEDACRLLMEFAEGRGLSPDYAWRDITGDF